MLNNQYGSAPRSTMRYPTNDLSEISGSAVVGERWYVAQTQPRREGRAIAHLWRQGYQVFCTGYRETVRHARKAGQFLAPLFPNYLFFDFDTAHILWSAGNGTRGVARLISQGETPAPLPYGIVEDLLARANAGGVMDWTPTFKVGQAVRIAHARFADLVGKLEHVDAAGRVCVLLKLLGRHVSVALRCEALIAVA